MILDLRIKRVEKIKRGLNHYHNGIKNTKRKENKIKFYVIDKSPKQLVEEFIKVIESRKAKDNFLWTKLQRKRDDVIFNNKTILSSIEAGAYLNIPHFCRRKADYRKIPYTLEQTKSGWTGLYYKLWFKRSDLDNYLYSKKLAS